MNKKDEKIKKIAAELSRQATVANNKAMKKFAAYQLPVKAAPSKGTKVAITLSMILGAAALATTVAGQLLHHCKPRNSHQRDGYHKVDNTYWDNFDKAKANDVADKAEDKVEDAADAVEDKVSDVVDKTKSAAKDAQSKIQRGIRKA